MVHDVPSLIAPVSGGFAAIVPRNGAAYNGFPATSAGARLPPRPCASLGPLQHLQHKPPHPLDGGDLHPLPRACGCPAGSGQWTRSPAPAACPLRMPHSTPAWMASICGFRPYCSRKTSVIRSRRGGVLPVLPGGVVPGDGDSAPQLRHQGPEAAVEHLLLAAQGAADAEGGRQGRLRPRRGCPGSARSAPDRGCSMLMAWTPLGRQVSMQTARSVDALSMGVSRHGAGRRLHAEARVRRGVFPGQRSAAICLRRLPGGGLVRCHHLGGRLHGDGVVLAAARAPSPARSSVSFSPWPGATGPAARRRWPGPCGSPCRSGRPCRPPDPSPASAAPA